VCATCGVSFMGSFPWSLIGCFHSYVGHVRGPAHQIFEQLWMWSSGKWEIWDFKIRAFLEKLDRLIAMDKKFRFISCTILSKSCSLTDECYGYPLQWIWDFWGFIWWPSPMEILSEFSQLILKSVINAVSLQERISWMLVHRWWPLQLGVEFQISGPALTW